MNWTFSAQDSKQQTCTRCKRLKVKCEREPDDAKTCRRCERANEQCVPAERRKRGAPKPKILQFNLEGAANAIVEGETPLTFEERVRQMNKRNVSGDRDWPREVLRRQNCLYTAIEYGYLTWQEAEEMYQKFVANLQVYLTIEIDGEKPMSELAKEKPKLCLAFIISALWNCKTIPLVRLEPLTEFLERVLFEQIFFISDVNLEVSNALFVLTIFATHDPPKKIFVQILTSLVLGMGQNLGSDEDINALMDNESGTEMYKRARDRCQTYLAIYTCAAAMSSSMSRGDLIACLPNADNVQQAMLKRGNELDRLLVHTMRFWSVAQSGINTLASNESQTPAQIREFLAERIGKLDECWWLLDATVSAENRDMGALEPATTSKLRLTLALYEHAMNKILLSREEVPDNATFTKYAKEIIDLAWKLITRFTQLVSSTNYFPRYMYFRPLHALCALTRIRLVLWSRGLELDTGMERAFEVVNSAWAGATNTSLNAEIMKSQLDRCTLYMNIKLDNPSLEENANRKTTYQLLQDVIGEASLEQQSDDHGRISDYVVQQQPAEMPMSDVEMESIIRDLFSELT